jgi:hypothetical protein
MIFIVFLKLRFIHILIVINMVQYQGDMSAKVLVISGAITSGSEAIFTTDLDVDVGRVAKPILIAKTGTDAILTGSLIVEYTGRLNDFPILTAITGSVNIALEVVNGTNWGVAVISNFEYSKIRITKVTSDLSDDVPNLTILASGVMN